MTGKKKTTGKKEQTVADSHKSIKPGILVCYGAQCTCTMGTAKAKLLVTSHNKYFINDAEGAEKLVATIEETKFQPPAFGSCKAQNNNSCVPALSGWENHSMHIEAGGKGVLLNISKATCTSAKGAKNTISIIEHGQEHVLTAQNLDNATLCSEINPILNEAAVKEIKKKIKPVGVTEVAFSRIPRKQASAEANSGEPETNASAETAVVVISSTETKSSATKDIEKVYVRPGQEAVFKVTKFNKNNPNPDSAEKQQVSWILYEGKYTGNTDGNGNNKSEVLVVYENHGDTLQLSFDNEGIYTVEGSGGKMSEASVMLELNVAYNKPVNFVSMAGITEMNSVFHVPSGQPITFYAQFKMPSSVDEKKPLEWWIYDSASALVYHSESSSQLVHVFEHIGEYTITLKYSGEQVAVKKIQTAYNTVQSIRLEGKDLPKLRPDTSFTAQVKSMGWSPLSDDWTPYQIDWYLHPPGSIVKQTIQKIATKKRGVYTEKLLPYTEEQLAKMQQNYIGSTTAEGTVNVAGSRIATPGEYILEAVSKGSGGPDQHGSDTLKIIVKHNEIKSITGPANTLIKKETIFEAIQFEFQDITPAEKAAICWEVSGLGNTEIIHLQANDKTKMKFRFNGFGPHTIKAWIKNEQKAAQATIEVSVSNINEAWWADGDEWKLRKAGYGQKIWAVVNHSNNIKGEQLQCIVHEQSSGKLITQKPITVSNDLTSKIEFVIDAALQKKLQEVKKSNSYKLFFRIMPQGFALNGSEKPWPTAATDYLEISTKPEIWNCRFVKNNKIATDGGYGDKDVCFCCNTRNLINKTVTIELWEEQGRNEKVQPALKIKVPDTGIIKVPFDYEQIKKVHEGKWLNYSFLAIHAKITEPDNDIEIDTDKDIAYKAIYKLNKDYDKVAMDKTPVLVTEEKEIFPKVVGLGKEAVLYISNEIATEIKIDKDGKIISYPDFGGYNNINEYKENEKLFCKKLSNGKSAFPLYKMYIYRGNKIGEAIKKLQQDLKCKSHENAEPTILTIARHVKSNNKDYNNKGPIPPNSIDNLYRIRYMYAMNDNGKESYRYRIVDDKSSNFQSVKDISKEVSSGAMTLGKRGAISIDPWNSAGLVGCIGIRNSDGTFHSSCEKESHRQDGKNYKFIYHALNNYLEKEIPELTGVYGRRGFSYKGEVNIAASTYNEEVNVFVLVEPLPEIRCICNLEEKRKKYYESFGEKTIKYISEHTAANKFKGLYIIAQRRQENGFSLNTPLNNPMNIKGSGDAGKSKLSTHETYNGKYQEVVDSFAQFTSEDAGFQGYLELLQKNYPYAYSALTTNSMTIDDFVIGLEDKGVIGAYATGKPINGISGTEQYKKSVKDNFTSVLNDYKKWLTCRLFFAKTTEEKNKLENDIKLLNQIK